MSSVQQHLATLRDYVERSTHWREGGATRHDALKMALPALERTLAELVEADAQPVFEVQRGHLTMNQADHWCREILAYSPGNPGDCPERRVMLYAGGRLSDALERAENGLAEWRAAALSNGKQAEAARATARIAINHLQAVLNKARTHDEQQAADTAARDWLISIGSEPT